MAKRTKADALRDVILAIREVLDIPIPVWADREAAATLPTRRADCVYGATGPLAERPDADLFLIDATRDSVLASAKGFPVAYRVHEEAASAADELVTAVTAERLAAIEAAGGESWWRSW